MLSSTMYSTTRKSSAPFDVEQQSLRLNSTEQPTIGTAMDNAIKKLRDMGSQQCAMLNNDPRDRPNRLNKNKRRRLTGKLNTTSSTSSSQPSHSSDRRFDSAVDMSRKLSILPQMPNSTMYSTATESSEQHESELTGGQSVYPLNSTELPTIAKIDNVIKNLRDIGPMQSTKKTPFSNDTRNTRQTRMIPTNGGNNHGKSTQNDLHNDGRASFVSSGNYHHEQSQAPDVSVPLIYRSRSAMLRNPSLSKGNCAQEPAMKNWLDELKSYRCQVGDQTKSSLRLIKQDLIRRKLIFSAKFKDHFLRSTFAKISSALEQFLADAYDEILENTLINTDTDQWQQTDRSTMSETISGSTETIDSIPQHEQAANQDMNYDLADGGNVSDGGISFPHEEDQIESAYLPGINMDANCKEMSCDERNDRNGENRQDDPVQNHNGNGVSQDIGNIAEPLQPTIHRRKRGNGSAMASDHLKKKPKWTNLVDTKKRHKCEFCEYSTELKYDLTRHMRTHTNERPHRCEVCDKRFSLNHNLNVHMKQHRDAFAFQCSNCRQGFSHERLWKLHESRCKARGYECHLCRKVFIQKHHLVDHMRAHTGEKLRCSICRKRFSSDRNLAFHVRSHGNLFRFQCSNCRQGFSLKRPWKSHESRCKSRQFECYLCSKKFYQAKGNLLVHMHRKHTGEKPFGCSDCPERFFKKSDLTKHTKRSHSNGN